MIKLNKSKNMKPQFIYLVLIKKVYIIVYVIIYEIDGLDKASEPIRG